MATNQEVLDAVGAAARSGVPRGYKLLRYLDTEPNRADEFHQR